MAKTQPNSIFSPARRSSSPIKIGLTGVSGSGKTYSALQLALGLADRVAVIDTEGGSSSLYSEIGPYDVASLRPPFTVGAILEGIEQAIAGDYGAVVIDGLSPVWRQLLTQKSVLDARPNSNNFANWKPISDEYAALVQAVIDCPIHVVATLRCKTAYVQTHENGRATIKRIGTEIEFRDGVEHEFGVLLEIDRDTHEARALKDRTNIFEGKSGRITRATGQAIRQWLASA